MLALFKKKKNFKGQAAVVVTETGVALVRLEKNAAGHGVLKTCCFEAAASDQEQHAVLEKFVTELKLQTCPVLSSMGMGEASLTLLEKPQVNDDELDKAVRWQIKDALPYRIDQAVIDVFEIPGQQQRGRPALVYVVAANKSSVNQRIEMLRQHQLQPTVVDIPELWLRNIAALLPQDQRGVAMLNLAANQGLITLTHQGDLYLARSIDYGYNALDVSAQLQHDEGMQLEPGLSPQQQRVLDSVVLEVQRSLDYYESHFAKPAINHLVVTPMPEQYRFMVEYLNSALGVQVSMLNVNELLLSDVPLTMQQQTDCLPAIGLVLREQSIQRIGEQAA